LYVLGNLKIKAAAGSEAPEYEYFVYTLNIIGKVEEATTVTRQVSKRLGDEAIKLVGIAEKKKPSNESCEVGIDLWGAFLTIQARLGS